MVVERYWTMTTVLKCCIFFFKQNTAYELRISDWSSDVCSSDLWSLSGQWLVEGKASASTLGSSGTLRAPRFHSGAGNRRRPLSRHRHSDRCPDSGRIGRADLLTASLAVGLRRTLRFSPASAFDSTKPHCRVCLPAIRVSSQDWKRQP